MPKIKLSLSVASIDAALEELERYKDKVDELPNKLTKRLTEDGTEQAKEIASYMSIYDTGELVAGIVPEFRDNKGYVVSTAPHSAFAELGTGLVGSRSPNPNDYAQGWRYDVNEHGEAGWWYPGDDGKYHWTQGMPSRPYMYETAQIIREAVPYVAEEILKDGD